MTTRETAGQPQDGVDIPPVWQARWIWMSGQDRSYSAPAPHLRTEFSVSAPIKQARVVVTALGWYRLTINGRKVGRTAELLPGWTDYRKRIPYHIFDVTGFISIGQNAIGALLGDGWYCGYLGWKNHRQFYGEYPEFLMQLEILSRDGSKHVVVSDEDWRAAEGPIRKTDIYHGEEYDARMEMPGWDLPGFPAESWRGVEARKLDPAVLLEPARHEPVRRRELLRPLEFWSVEPGRWIYDLGQNMVGRARVKAPSVADQVVTIRFAEMLKEDRTLYTDNYRDARSTDTYICKGGTGFETWEPLFTFHGFRYVELGGLNPDVQPDGDWVRGVVLHSDLRQIGSFACSNDDLNRLQSNIVWGQKGNFVDVPTDCPQRDERLGWTGDAQVFAPTACFNFDTERFFEKWMTDLRDAQTEEGAFPHVAPNILDDDAYDSPAWADAGVIIPWEVYVRYGNRQILEDNFDAMLAWIEYQQEKSPGLLREDRGFGDWLQPYAAGEDPLRGDTDRSLIGTAYFAYTTRLVSRVAALLRDCTSAGDLEQLAERVRGVFFDAFWTSGNRLKSDTQTAYALVLAFDLLPPEHRDSALARLVELIEEAGGHLRTGFVGTPLLNPVLTQFGRSDLAYQILLKETYPGWIYSIRQGATTMWERWNSYSRIEGFGDASMNSFNHYAYGAIGQWMYESIAGLKPDAESPGYEHFFVCPQPGGGLTWAQARLETRYGLVASGWHHEDETLVIQAEVPEGSTATIILPIGAPERIVYRGRRADSRFERFEGRLRMPVGSGTHTFVTLPAS